MRVHNCVYLCVCMRASVWVAQSSLQACHCSVGRQRAHRTLHPSLRLGRKLASLRAVEAQAKEAGTRADEQRKRAEEAEGQAAAANVRAQEAAAFRGAALEQLALEQEDARASRATLAVKEGELGAAQQQLADAKGEAARLAVELEGVQARLADAQVKVAALHTQLGHRDAQQGEGEELGALHGRLAEADVREVGLRKELDAVRRVRTGTRVHRASDDGCTCACVWEGVSASTWRLAAPTS